MSGWSKNAIKLYLQTNIETKRDFFEDNFKVRNFIASPIPCQHLGQDMLSTN